MLNEESENCKYLFNNLFTKLSLVYFLGLNMMWYQNGDASKMAFYFYELIITKDSDRFLVAIDQ